MKLIKIVIAILGSSLFIPVSCTLGVVGGTKTIAWLDSRNVQKGDQVHSRFSVVAITPGSQSKSDFIVVPLQQLEEVKAGDEPLSFIMPLSESSKEIDRSQYSYNVLEDRGNEQKIEVKEAYKDGDSTIWSQYRATDKDIYPIASRMFYFGYMFQALPYAIVISICLYTCGKVLKRRRKVQKEKDS